MIVGGRNLELEKDQVIRRMRDEAPEPIREHLVEVDTKVFPPKQVLAVMTGWERTSFTTMEAQRVLTKLGFTCRRAGHRSSVSHASAAAMVDTSAVGQSLQDAVGLKGAAAAAAMLDMSAITQSLQDAVSVKGAAAAMLDTSAVADSLTKITGMGSAAAAMLDMSAITQSLQDAASVKGAAAAMLDTSAVADSLTKITGMGSAAAAMLDMSAITQSLQDAASVKGAAAAMLDTSAVADSLTKITGMGSAAAAMLDASALRSALDKVGEGASNEATKAQGRRGTTDEDLGLASADGPVAGDEQFTPEEAAALLLYLILLSIYGVVSSLAVYSVALVKGWSDALMLAVGLWSTQPKPPAAPG